MWLGEQLPILQSSTGTSSVPGNGSRDYGSAAAGMQWCVDLAVESSRNYGRLLVELSKDKKRFSKVCDLFFRFMMSLSIVLCLCSCFSRWSTQE